jgi:DNA-binding transcriptional regulator YhcF (GntR family)
VTREEIKNLILRRAYAGAFEEGVDDTFNLHRFAQDNGINNDEAWKAYQELEDSGLIRIYANGGVITSTSHGLLRAEQLGLADRALIEKQEKIRIKLLAALVDLRERATHGEITSWKTLICKAGISVQDFQNNDHIMRDFGFVETESGREYDIMISGKKLVDDYRKRKRCLEVFERLEKLEGATEQQRGHRLEDLLGELIEHEGWIVDVRVRAQGQENDIIIHKGMDYFFMSCKWEKDPIQPEELDIMYSRASGRKGIRGAVILSMSGFTDNCVNQAIRKMENCHILLFGNEDIGHIFCNRKTFTSLLDEKYNEAMLRGRILIDGKIRDMKPDSK